MGIFRILGVEMIFATDAFDVKFVLAGKEERDVYVFDVVCAEKRRIGFFPNRFLIYMYKSDLERMIDLLELHCDKIRNNGVDVYDEYSPHDLAFMIKMFDGHVDKSEQGDDGYFSISWMFNCWQEGEEDSNAYIGFESVTTFLDATKFTQNVKMAVQN